MRFPARSAGGAVLTAAAVVVLAGTPAAAEETRTDEAPSIAHRQVGMQVGSTPVAVHAEFAVPAWLLPVAPERLVSLNDAAGRPVLRLDATRVHARTQTGTVRDHLGVVDRVAKPTTSALDAATAGVRHAPLATTRPSSNRPAAVPDAAAAPSRTRATQFPLRVDTSATALGGDYAWVPMQRAAGSAGGSTGLPELAGLALLALGAAAAGITVVRRRATTAG